MSSIRKVIVRPTITRQTALIFLIMVAIFVIAIILRVFPAKYGFFLNEFDPYFDYRAADFIVDRFQSNGLAGLGEYFRWIDFGSWYPEGRDVARTSQTGLQFTAAFLFLIATALGSSIQLYDLVVLFPVFAGGLLVIVIFLLARKIGGNTAGLLAALAVSVAPPLIQRGALGWFKSEPLALLLTITASYVFLTMFDSKIGMRGTLLRGLLAGSLLGFANTTWGGAQFFVIVFGLLFIVSPFLKTDLKKVVYGGAVLVAADLLMSSIFPRPGPSFIFSFGGIALIGSIVFAYIGYKVKTYSSGERDFYKTMVKVIFLLGLLAMVVLSFDVIPGLSGRYNTAINPFLISGNALVESVAEHKSPTGANFFSASGTLIFLGVLGAMIALRQRTIGIAFALVLAIAGVYVASSFARLMVFSTLGIALLAGIGFAELLRYVLRTSEVRSLKRKVVFAGIRKEMKIAFVVLMSILLIIPAAVFWIPSVSGSSSSDSPVSIANSALGYRFEVDDWLETLAWIRENTPEDSVVAAWWDYGYWITVMGNRTSIADNATLNQTRIETIGRMFMSDEREAFPILQGLDADYVVVFVSTIEFRPTTAGGNSFYQLGGGGDESKMIWFIRIPGLPVEQYLREDIQTPTDFFWANTFLGKLLPFSFLTFTGSDDGQFAPGATALYTYSMHYSTDGDGPITLAYESSNLRNSRIALGSVSIAGQPSTALAAPGVLVYKVDREKLNEFILNIPDEP